MIQKFRVWIPDEGKDETGKMFELPFTDGEHLENINENGIEVTRYNDYIVKESGGNTIETDGYEPCEAIIMQFTGFKDANGKEIYDRDILNEKKPIFDNGHWEVKWNDIVGMWDAYYNKWSTTHSLSHLLKMKQYFVVGNVFDGCAEQSNSV